MKFKRLSAAVLLLFIMVSGLWAQTFFITDYIYKIDGKTSEAVMDSMMGETSRFESEDELKAYLELRKQELWNTNLFSKVDVKYIIDFSVDTNSFVTVNIEVDEAASSLFFPYPKYDSNYGFVMGLRYKERNLLGMMATLDAALDIKQQERSFKKGDYYYDIPIGGIKLGSTTINVEPYGEFDFLNKENSYFGLNFDETGWKLGSATIAATFESKIYYNDMKQSKITFSFAENGLEIGPGKLKSGVTVVFKPRNVPVLDTLNFNLGYSDVPVGNSGAMFAFTTTNELYPKDTAMWFTHKSFNKFGVSFTGIELGENVTMSESPSVIFQPKQNNSLPFRFYGFENTLGFDFADGKIRGKSLTNYVEYIRFQEKYNNLIDNYVKTVTTFSFLMTHDIKDSVLLKTWRNDRKGMYELDVDLRLEKPFSFLEDHITLSPIVTFYNQFSMDNGSPASYRPRLELAFSASASGGTINRINAEQLYFAFRDNFRYGMTYSMQAGARWVPDADNILNPRVFARGEITAFPLSTARFNPSFRLTGVLGGYDRMWFDKTSDSDPWEVVSPVDSDYKYSFNSFKYNEIQFNPEGLNDLLRGILLENEDVQRGGFNSKAVIAGNINLTTAFLNFEDFGHTYLSPFYDFALFLGKDGYNILHSVGIEGIAILDSHPLYPFRVSLGFNADDLFRKLNKEDVQLESELFIGVGWYF